ncbi:hypothetical protein VTN77DRAFT_2815 [Rasamsonia byssochlamydoides]|uniref:uncharacterized protein n=1 Tax=Rasamsonia byssochlamydoides TaxID=89139 RepID=UPI003742AA5B
MSDDEDYYDDDYSGDWSWYDDASLGVADDLAEAATYSPVAVDDPSLDTLESFSDWEYYSDDFYDDDPTVLRRRGTANPLQEAENQLDGPPRKKKRKGSITDGIPELSLGPAVVDLPTDIASFKGVIWRKPDSTEQKPDLYEPGHGEKVALFKDWREVFETSHYKNAWLREPSPKNKARENGHVGGLDVPKSTLREIIPQSQVDTVVGEEYDLPLDPTREASYSPPPMSIGELARPLHEPKIRKGPPLRTKSLLKEAISVDDSLSHMATHMANLLPSPEEEVPDQEATSPVQEQAAFQQLLRVEISAASSPPPPLLITPKRRRGRRPQASIALEEEGSTRARHPSREARVAVERDNNSRQRRRSRIFSSLQEQTPLNNNRKRRPAPSPPPIPPLRRKKRRVSEAVGEEGSTGGRDAKKNATVANGVKENNNNRRRSGRLSTAVGEETPRGAKKNAAVAVKESNSARRRSGRLSMAAEEEGSAGPRGAKNKATEEDMSSRRRSVRLSTAVEEETPRARGAKNKATEEEDNSNRRRSKRLSLLQDQSAVASNRGKRKRGQALSPPTPFPPLRRSKKPRTA